MPAFWAIAEQNADGSLARISTEVATAARHLAAAAAGSTVAGIVVGADAGPAAAALAAYLPDVRHVDDGAAAGHAWAVIAAERVAEIIGDDPAAVILVGAGPDGRDLAGTLSALTDRGVLVNATGLAWRDRLAVEMSVFGGKLITTSGFTGSGGGIVTVRPNSITAEPLDTSGAVTEVRPAGPSPAGLPAVAVLESVEEAGAAVPIEEARIVVSGGRGVGRPEGFGLVGELAEALGGAVGATRAAVDSGWIPYSQQIGQTGKIVKPQLYLALGISGAIQHKVGMQTAGAIVAVNRDPDAPIAEFADLLVVGDLFEVGRALLVALRGRTG